MPNKNRSPNKFLAQAYSETNKTRNGKLKIYLGSAPGVGKTYTMLKNALALRATGLDVVIGLIETHGRSETADLDAQFEHLPLTTIEYHGKTLFEFNLAAALKRKPDLLLVDEMAHTNLSGLKNSKRWQDIRELLDQGINVTTTLNVQHIESLNDNASQIIHSAIKETVPDFMIDIADSIELIDIPPEELLKRLHEGKIYIPAQAKIAEEHFFREGNLIALRELALRATAMRVNEDVRNYRNTQDIKHIWATQERWMVCIGSNPSSARLIRTTRQLTNYLQAEWMVIHIKNLNYNYSKTKQAMAADNLRLARQLGAKMRILTSKLGAKEIIDLARKENITTIVVGKSHRPNWQNYLIPSLATKLIELSEEINIHVIAGTKEQLNETIQKHPIHWREIVVAIIILTCLIVFIFSI